MERKILAVAAVVSCFMLTGCVEGSTNAAEDESRNVNRQQQQYAIGQPVPVFNFSLERDLQIKLYQLRNKKVATYTVWRSDYGMIEGYTASLGYGLPYDVSLTNPLVATDIDNQGEEHSYQGGSLTSIEQPEPNGIFASKNTTATWVMAVDEVTGSLMPIYIEGKVTVYPYPVTVDWEHNRVARAKGKAVTISSK